MDLAGALEPAAVDAPYGPNLKGSLEWGEFERLAAGKPAQYVGPTIVAPAEDPPWSAVVERATKLLNRTKDLRLAVHCTKGLIRLQGWSGLASGLGLIRGLLERYWDGLHPELDREDNDDPTLRLNCLADLSEDEQVQATLRTLPVVASARAGKLTLKDVLQARGDAKPANGQAKPAGITPSVVAAVFAEVDFATLSATAGDVNQALDHLLGIESFVAQHVGAGHTPNLVRLKALLQEANRLLADKVAARQPPAAPAAEALQGEDMSISMSGAHGTNGASAGGAVPVGAIRSRDDVVKALEAICEYYRVHEPSSPLPLLLNRARRLVTKDFLEILQDLAPAGVAQAQTIRGPEETKS
ncbi:MAG TPA: type VI secretion system protein TssA [Polyangia bacterium]